VSKGKYFWNNGNMIWIWIFLIGGTVIGIIAKGAVLLNDLERRETRVEKLETYKNEDVKFKVELNTNVKNLIDKVDNIDKKLDRALRRQ